MKGSAGRSLWPSLVVLTMAAATSGCSAPQGAVRATPTGGSAAQSPSPSTTPPAARRAPVGDGAVLAWDSTHRQLVAYVNLASAVAPAKVATWDGAWHEHPDARGPGLAGVLVDAPPLHGVVLVTVELGAQFDVGGSNTWLWDGAQWSTLPIGNFTPCVGSPASGAWDAVHSQVVVVMAGQCRNAGGFPPSETWLFDGRAWRRAGVVPAGVVRPSLAWDVTANHVVMLQADPAVGLREWSWTGQAWAPVGAPDKGAPQPTQLGGAGFDATAGGVVALPASGPPFASVVKEGMWSTLNTTTFPQRVVALTGDSTNHRVLVLGEAPVPVNSTPDALATSDFLMTWSGHTWDVL